MARRAIKFEEEPSVNLTPLIDVVFVILIMFIVIAPLLELDKVDLAEAGKTFIEKNASVQESSSLRIYVRADNRFLFNETEILLENLKDKLQEGKKLYPQAKLQAFLDKRAHFGSYQALKNAAEEAGFEEMDVILKPH